MLTLHDRIPEVAGTLCAAVLAQAYYYRGRLVTEANAIFLRLSDGWHRIFIQAGIVFWQRVDAVDGVGEYDRHHYPVTDLGAAHGFSGRRLAAVSVVDLAGGGELRLGFTNAPTLVLQHLEGTSRVMVEAPGHPW